MKTKKLLTMVVSIILMLVMSISIVGCQEGTPTQEASLYDYSKTLNSWYLSKLENVNDFEEKSLNLTFSSTASETEELEYYEKLGDTEKVTKEHTSSAESKVEASLQFKKVGEDLFAYAIIKGTTTQIDVSVDYDTQLLVTENGTIYRELEYRLGVIAGEQPTYYLTCKNHIDVTGIEDNEYFKDETTYTYTTYENKENYLADLKEVYSLFENYESTIMLSMLEEEFLGGILEISNTEDLSTMEWINYCVESRETPFLPMFLADTKTFSKTGNVYSSELDKIITMPMGSNVVLANIKYTTDITETQLKSSTMIMDMDMASSSSSSMTNYNYQKLDFSNKANFKVLSNLNGYEINDDLDVYYFFNPNALFGE